MLHARMYPVKSVVCVFKVRSGRKRYWKSQPQLLGESARQAPDSSGVLELRPLKLSRIASLQNVRLGTGTKGSTLYNRPTSKHRPRLKGLWFYIVRTNHYGMSVRMQRMLSSLLTLDIVRVCTTLTFGGIYPNSFSAKVFVSAKIYFDSGQNILI